MAMLCSRNTPLTVHYLHPVNYFKAVSCSVTFQPSFVTRTNNKTTSTTGCIIASLRARRTTTAVGYRNFHPSSLDRKSQSRVPSTISGRLVPPPTSGQNQGPTTWLLPMAASPAGTGHTSASKPSKEPRSWRRTRPAPSQVSRLHPNQSNQQRSLLRANRHSGEVNAQPRDQRD